MQVRFTLDASRVVVVVGTALSLVTQLSLGCFKWLRCALYPWAVG